MPKWMWWGGGAVALALFLLKKDETPPVRARVTWQNDTGAQVRDFEKLETAKAFADAMIAAGARDVSVSPLT